MGCDSKVLPPYRIGALGRRAIKRSGVLLAGLTLGVLLQAAAGASIGIQDGARAVIPVRQISLGSGVRLYIVPLTIGKTFTHAKLESGSTGLRVMPNILASADVRPTSRGDVYCSSEGPTFSGMVAKAPVTLGASTQVTALQVLSAVGSGGVRECDQASSDGGGITEEIPLAEGIPVILGIGMASAEFPSFLPSIGVHRWIVRLPRPDGHFPGRLILNPDDEEVENFVKIPLTSNSERGIPDSLSGCLMNDKAKLKLCGLVQLDTGVDGIRVQMPASMAPWQEGTRATLLFNDPGGHPIAAEHLIVGLEAQASRLSFKRSSDKMIRIYAGLSPYLVFSILYDPGRRAIGFSPRRTLAEGPDGVIFSGR
jgi:hypothetical protein